MVLLVWGLGPDVGGSAKDGGFAEVVGGFEFGAKVRPDVFAAWESSGQTGVQLAGIVRRLHVRYSGGVLLNWNFVGDWSVGLMLVLHHWGS